MARYQGNPITAAIARKRRQLYPPDLLGNGPDRLLNAPVVSPVADRIRAAWLPALGNQAVPAIGERGYLDELPWDE